MSRLAVGWAVVLVTAAGFAACGDGDDDDATTTDTTDTTCRAETTTTSTTAASSTTTPTSTSTSSDATSPPPATAAISLTVEVTADGQPLRSGTVACGDAAEGTGFLADPAAAAAACDLLRTDPGAVQRLAYGPPADLLCIEIYGGPEVARVTGSIDGLPVDATVDRSDGCGIDDWNALAALLGPAT